MLKKILIISLLLLIVLAAGLIIAGRFETFLFQTASWLTLLSLFLGLLTGVIRSIVNKSVKPVKKHPEAFRHNVDSFLEHWGTSLFLIVLIISGFLFYFNSNLFETNLHFISLVFMLFFGGYFLADFFVAGKFKYLLPNFEDIFRGTLSKYLFRIAWRDDGKYLSSQKSALLGWIAIGFGIVLTGVVKMVSILWQVPAELVSLSTRAHDILGVLFILMLIVHVLIVLAVRHYRGLLPSWFTGKIKE